MTEQQQLGKTLWAIADKLRGAMNADDFRDYMLSFLFLRYLSDNYEKAAKKELGNDYPHTNGNEERSSLVIWYEQNPDDVAEFETQMRRKTHYVIDPQYLWTSISHMALIQDDHLLETLQNGFKHIENESFKSTFSGLFSEIDLTSQKLGKTYTDRNTALCTIISQITKGLDGLLTDTDALGDAYEYLIGQFAAGAGKKAGEFYTPQHISSILSGIVMLDPQDPATGLRQQMGAIMDFACGSGSLLLNVRTQMKPDQTTRLYGQEKNVTTYNLARMNMLLHGVKDTEFDIFCGDTLSNSWDILRETNPAIRPQFDAVVANPPFSYRWEPKDDLTDDLRFRHYGLAPKSAADLAFLLHGFHYLKDDGVMAIILPHGVLFRGGTEANIRKKLLEDGNIDTVIGLAPNLFYSTGIPVCILILKKCKKFNNVLFINASEKFEKGKRQNRLTETHIKEIVSTYQQRPKQIERYARSVGMDEIRENDCNLNITRYVSTAKPEVQIDLTETHKTLAQSEEQVHMFLQQHNAFLKELGLPALPDGNVKMSQERSIS
ncbi:MAG: type I restriction-modification system subunit M [Aestuariivita sp.]|nr:type I restriction-modification system subunit M [Aestuariivita sp.]